jgi:hypothetical protein
VPPFAAFGAVTGFPFAGFGRAALGDPVAAARGAGAIDVVAAA